MSSSLKILPTSYKATKIAECFRFTRVFYRHIPTLPWTIPLITAVLATLLIGYPVSAGSGEVIVVKSAELKPHQDVLRGFRDACDCEARELKLRGDEGEERILKRAPDAVVAIGTTAFKKIRTIRKLPLIYTMVIPSEAALSPAANISGVSMDLSPETYIAVMKELFPKAKRIGLIYDPRYSAEYVKDASRASRAAGIELVRKQAGDPREIPGLLDELRNKIDVFWMAPDPTVVTTETVDYLLRFSFQHNVPMITFSKKYVEMGAVASLDIDPYDMGVQAGEIIKRLSTDRTTAIRVYARKSRLTINSKVAAKMGLKIKDELTMKVEKIE